MTLPPAPNDAESVTTGAMTTVCHQTLVDAARDSAAWAMTGVVPAGAVRAAPASWSPRRIGARWPRSWSPGSRPGSSPCWSAGTSPPLSIVGTVWLADRALHPRGDDASSRSGRTTRARSTHFLLLGAARGEPGRRGARVPQGERGTGTSTRCCSRRSAWSRSSCSWLLVHTVFVLRYAHVYYTEPEGRHRLQGHGTGATRLRRLRLHRVHRSA